MSDEKEGDELVRKLAELEKKKQAEPPPELTSDVVINLAGMTPLQYAQQLAREAKKYRTPVKLLEKAVEAVRIEQEAEKLLEPHWEVPPSEDPVDAAQLFADIEARTLQHVVMPRDLAFVVALWIGQTWIHQHGTYSPILGITSAERDSGKSTLMGVIAFLVRRSLLSVGVSSAALYRSIEKWNPTFVVDEADDAFVDNPDLRQVINSGWTRGQGVMRCDPDTNEPRRFSTFCPKAIALKGKKMPDTMLSRTIFVEMKRRLKSEKVDHFRHLDDAGFARMRSQLARWAEDSGEALGAALPDQPEGFINRTASNWQLMFAIADSLGEEAGARARTVAQHIAGVTDMASAGVALLQDIKTMFDRSTLDYLTSKAIIERLTADPEKPRAEWSRGRPITEKGVAGLLHEYRISSRTVGPEGARAKGYRKADFEDAWRRYLAPQGAVSPSHSDILPFSRSALCNDYTSAEKSAVQPNDAERKKNGHFSNEIKALNGRTGNNPEIAPLDLKGSDPGPIPDCDHCGQPGTAAWPREQGLQEQAPRCDHCGGLASPADPLKPWNWPSRPDGVRLHAGCEAAFHDAEQSREMTPPPPLSNSYEVGDAADVPPPAPEPLPPQSTNGAERDVRHCAYCGQPDTAADPLHHGHWRPRKPDGDWLHAGCIDPWRAGGWRLK